MKVFSKKFNCQICGTFEYVRGGGGNAGRYLCDTCRKNSGRQDLDSPQYIAHKEVSKARRRGELPDPKTLKCVDCGVDATEYDHRDYSKPLEVNPVCRGCNRRRGSAINHTTKTDFQKTSKKREIQPFLKEKKALYVVLKNTTSGKSIKSKIERSFFEKSDAEVFCLIKNNLTRGKTEYTVVKTKVFGM